MKMRPEKFGRILFFNILKQNKLELIPVIIA